MSPEYSPAIQTLDSKNFDGTEALRIAAQKTHEPVLLIVDETELTEVLCWLAEKDDVCLSDSPAELVEYRQQSLAAEVEGLRDPLTNLLNRQRFEHLLNESASTADFNRPVSLLLLDLDYFKIINDQHGHAVGDEVLRDVAGLLREKEPEFSAVARVGGEEFSILLNGDESDAAELAESLRGLIEEAIVSDGIRITTSIGISTTRVSTNSQTLHEQADQALYSAKDQGRNCCVSYGQVVAHSKNSGQQVEVLSLENQARVLAQRVANVITMRSKSILNSARQEADVDGLTGCFTRRYLDRRLADEFADANSETAETPLCVAFFDLDHFGHVNKQFGWPTGDKLLVEVCDVVRERIRETDWMGRYGGEEFCVVMPGIDLNSAQKVMQRILKAVESTDFATEDGRPVAMTLSIGLAMATATDAGAASLIDRASGHALTAKNRGRNQLCIG